MLALIGSDGKRAMVRRSIATEASYVLRDLLDAEDLLLPACPDADAEKKKSDTSVEKSEAGAFLELNNASNFFDQNEKASNGKCTDTIVKSWAPDEREQTSKLSKLHSEDQMEYLFGPDNTKISNMSTTERNNCVEALNRTDVISAKERQLVSVCDAVLNTPLCISASRLSHDSLLNTLVLPFPYFTSDILLRVCAHMTAHYQLVPVAGKEHCLVECVKVRQIPKPMVLPLEEYLDPVDQDLINDWDEPTTVNMLKVATLLNYEALVELSSAKLATYLCYKSIDGIRTLLHAENDFSPDEEAEICKEQMLE